MPFEGNINHHQTQNRDVFSMPLKGNKHHHQTQNKRGVKRAGRTRDEQQGRETDQAQQWNFQPLVAIVKQPLIEQREQCIQDGTVGLEDLINEGHLGCGQVPICLPGVLIILQTCTWNAQWNLLWNQIDIMS